MARYNTAILTIVSNNESYQIVRHNWAREMPDSKMIREGKYPGLWLSAPATDYVGLARSQGVDGEAVTTVKDLEPALRRGMDAHHAREPAVPDRGVGGARGYRRRLHLVPGLAALGGSGRPICVVGALGCTLDVQQVRLACSHRAPPRSWTCLSRL